MLEVLQKASQAVRVTWKTDELDKENEEHVPAAGQTACYSLLLQWTAMELMLYAFRESLVRAAYQP